MNQVDAAINYRFIVCRLNTAQHNFYICTVHSRYEDFFIKIQLMHSL